MRGLRQLVIFLAAVLFGLVLPTMATTAKPVPAPSVTVQPAYDYDATSAHFADTAQATAAPSTAPPAVATAAYDDTASGAFRAVFEFTLAPGSALADGASELGGAFYARNAMAASAETRGILDEATNVFGKGKLADTVDVLEADILIHGSEMPNGVTFYSRGVAKSVYLTRGADAVTFLDEGGHVAGYLGKSSLAHLEIYSFVFNNPAVRSRALNFIRTMHPDSLERFGVLRRLVEKKQMWGVR